MKKVLLLLFLLYSAIGFAQNDQYEIRFEDLSYSVWSNVKNRTSSNMHITLLYGDGSSEVLYHREIGDNTTETGFSLDPIMRNKKPVKIHFELFINFSPKDDARVDEYISLNNGYINSKTFIHLVYGMNPSVSFTYSICPPINLAQPLPDNNIGYNKEFTLAVKPNSAIYSGSVYNWQYHVKGDRKLEWNWFERTFYWKDVWRDMPASTSGKTSFEIIPEEFLVDDGFSPQQVIGKKIYFRINSCGGNYSNVVTYTIRKSAPSITRTQTFQANCYGGNKASAKIYFDRQIDPGEKISYVLYDTSVVAQTTPDTLYIPIKNGNNLTKFEESNGEYYLELTNIPPSENYKFEIIGSDDDPSDDTQFNPTDADGNSVDVGESGYGNGAVLYTGDGTYSTEIVIPETTPVEFVVTDYKDITCHGAKNGQIKLSASGGKTGKYTYQISKDGQILTNFEEVFFRDNTVISIEEEGVYYIKVRDFNGCKAYVIQDGEVDMSKIHSEAIEINEPSKLTAVVDTTYTRQPTAHGFTNGVIALKVVGGTSFSSKNQHDYEVSWSKTGGTSFVAETERIDVPGAYIEKLINIGGGTYTARVTDANGCTFDLTYELAQPDLLAVDLSVETQISCNTANDGDSSSKSKDGKLKAVASGGVAPYTFTWMKLDEENKEWETLSGAIKTDSMSVLSALGPGTYAVNIKDAKGIVLGVYKDDFTLKTAIPVEITLQGPDAIQISITQQDVLCKGGASAWINASVSGGTLENNADYVYQWKNEADEIVGTTAKITDLKAGVYWLKVTDAKGCFATEKITIDEPVKALKIISSTSKQPTATGRTDGYIQYEITGGTPFVSPDILYEVKWTKVGEPSFVPETVIIEKSISDTDTTYIEKLINIGEGTYTLKVTDANWATANDKQGACMASSTFTIEDPDPLTVTIEEIKEISCHGANNGVLKVVASGGFWLPKAENGGLHYYYTWKKKVDGVWDTLKNQTKRIATGLGAGTYAVNIKDANGVILGEYDSADVLVKATDSIFHLKEPDVLRLSFKKQDVYCFSGSDAWAEVHITGGTSPYQVKWSTGATTKKIKKLSAGTYAVTVTDARGCTIKDSVKIDQPENPVTIAYLNYDRPSSIGAKDAWIEAVVTGGTPFEDGTYDYYWKNESGVLLNAQITTSFVNGDFVVRLDNIPAGGYYLTVHDKNYTMANTKMGCTHAKSKFVIHEPIEAVIEVKTPISCHSANAYQDEFSDGSLIAHVRGGVPFTSGQPYIYHWKKQTESGQWVDMPGQTGKIAINLSDGNYALNVEDALGNVIGTYEGDQLIKAADRTFYLHEPDLLKVNFITTEISCDKGNNGTAEVLVTGGTPPYSIKWSNGQNTSKIHNLIGGTYFAFVTDSRGCQVTGNVVVKQPSGINITLPKKNQPTCFGGNDGSIGLQVSGGVPPYTYRWNTGETTKAISGLSKGVYTVKVTDDKGCIAYKEVELEDPQPIQVHLGRDRTLCRNQELPIDISIPDPGAVYQWESANGFSSNSPKVVLHEAGIYTASITTSSGCVGQDQIQIFENNTAIDADFLITSQAFVGEEVVIVNVSDPLGEATEWLVPDGVTVISESNEAIIVKFKESGTYEFRLRTLEGDCYQDYTKKIVVKEPTEVYGEAVTKDGSFIKEFKVYPNPSSGDFQVKIVLAEKADVALRLISLLTADVSETKMMQNKTDYRVSYNVMIPTGTYILLLETPKGKEMRRVIIK